LSGGIGLLLLLLQLLLLENVAGFD